MILILPTLNVRQLLDQYIFEPADSITVLELTRALDRFYGHETSLKINVGYDYSGYLDVRFAFDTDEDIVMYKLKYEGV